MKELSSNVLLAVIGLVSSATINPISKEKVIVDTDAGVDDAFGLILLLKSAHKVDLLGITTIFGNTGVDNVTENVLKTLHVTNRLDVPVYKGSKYPMIRTGVSPTAYFGDDGFGDFGYPEIPTKQYVKEEPAAAFLAGAVEKYPGEITLLAMGPLTNLATATVLNPNFYQKLKKIYMIGGTMNGEKAAFGPGLAFNTAVDPEASVAFFNRAQPNASIVLFPSGSAVNRSSIDWRLNVLGAKENEAVKFLNKAEQKSLGNRTTWGGHTDEALVGAFLDPQTILTSEWGTLSVNATGYSKVVPGNNTLIIKSMDETKLEKLFYDTL